MKNTNIPPIKDKEIQEDIKKLVLARIKATSDDLSISIGSTEYSKEELLKSVEKGNELGQEITEIQMEYLRDMAAGTIYQEAMLRNFRFMLSTKASPSQKDAAPYLWFNRKYQVLLGDQQASY